MKYAGHSHVISVCVPYEHDHINHMSCAWIRFSTRAITEEFIDFMNDTTWYGQTVYVSLNELDTVMQERGRRSLMKNAVRQFTDVWYLPLARHCRTSGHAPWGA